MILLIAYGNSLRQDDGAGLILARQLEAILRRTQVPVRRIASQQLVPELAAELAQPPVKAVIFVDTRLATTDSGPQVRIEPLAQTRLSARLGHYLDPATLLFYAEQLYGHRPLAWQVTVPGYAFAHGQTLSPATRTALRQAQPLLQDWLEQLPHHPLSPSGPTADG
jgi:hydrogenase maturation protease